MGGTYQRESKY